MSRYHTSIHQCRQTTPAEHDALNDSQFWIRCIQLVRGLPAHTAGGTWYATTFRRCPFTPAANTVRHIFPVPPQRVHKKTSIPGSIPVPLQRGHDFLLLSRATAAHTEPLTVTSRLVPAAPAMTTWGIAIILTHYCQPLPPQDEQLTE